MHKDESKYKFSLILYTTRKRGQNDIQFSIVGLTALGF